MPKIRFTADPKLPRDLEYLGFKKGDIVELPVDQCNRWIRRNVAEIFTGKMSKPEKMPKPEKAAPVAADPEHRPATESTPPEETPAAEDGDSFDPKTAPIEAVRKYLDDNDVRVHPMTGDAKMREKAEEVLSDQ